MSASHPIDVYKITDSNGTVQYSILNGHHRAAAAKIAGVLTWPCNVHQDLPNHEIMALKINSENTTKSSDAEKLCLLFQAIKGQYP